MIRNNKYVYSKEVIDVPSHLHAGRFFIDSLHKYGDKVALTNGETHKSITYNGIVCDAMSVAISLTRMGVKRGETVGVCMETRVEYWPIVIGVSCTGAVINPFNIGYTADELNHVLNITKPKYLIISETAFKLHSKTFSTLPFIEKTITIGAGKITYDDLLKNKINYADFDVVDVDGKNDTLFVLFSSGTTGLPKGVMQTHLNVISICSLKNALNTDDRTLFITPWYHTMGLLGVLRYLQTGCDMVYLPKYETNLYLQTIERYKIKQLLLAPPVLVATAKSKANYDVSSVTFIYSGAAPLRKDTNEEAKKKFFNAKAVTQGYGMTETTLAIIRDTYELAHLAKPGGVGFVVSGCVVKVVDIETGKPLGPNEPGEIRVKGPSVMKGYIGKDISEDFDDEGFYKTGDIGYYDDDEYFFIVDRLKELIKYKGFQVPPAEIEAVLLQHPAILDAGVAGVSHPAGELPRAFVVRQPGARVSEDDIHAFIAEKLSDPKHLRGGIRFVNEIPKNPSGKILRRKLKEMVLEKSKL
ncbi:4-coumarate--CoA ligase 1-like isoform X1 [Colias croceus]|uniref:4-coumarate--CoA ligase 1-like isoform X1 n=1 Tax=Colias crocea TaxID=72248 RepID=UPI001E27ADFE|nr:4-coumarate--CoA ligase 1-like isoform X1 [Colias croceus]